MINYGESQRKLDYRALDWSSGNNIHTVIKVYTSRSDFSAR